MKNLKFKTLFALYAVIFLSCIFQSCCEEKYTITSSGTMEAWIVNAEDDRIPISTITGAFILNAYFHETQVAHHPVSLVSSGYATSCKETMLNKIDTSDLDLSVDKAFLFGEDTIPAHTNLLNLEGVGVELQSHFRGSMKFLFTDVFFTNATLENGDYLFTVQGATDDGVQLHSEITLEMDL